jgi:two-component system response regulator AtoC
MDNTRSINASAIIEHVMKTKDQAETDAILTVLNSTRWNRKQAAARLNIGYKALLYKMKKHGVEDALVPMAAQADEASRPLVMAAKTE